MVWGKTLLKQPGAWVPFAMSLCALVLLVGYTLVFGVQRNADEGAPARLFQLLMVGQIPIIFYFALKNLQVKPKETLQILFFQLLTGLVPIALVLYLEM